ncbi:MAG: hypothetical protein JWO84_241 [Parcubacteria group bacterium]|nr:hypothetical protein [Parcubacteria group bacterium]
MKNPDREYLAGVSALADELLANGEVKLPQGATGTLAVASIFRLDRLDQFSARLPPPTGISFDEAAAEHLSMRAAGDLTHAYFAFLKLRHRSSPHYYRSELVDFPELEPWMLNRMLELQVGRTQRYFLPGPSTSMLLGGEELYVRGAGTGWCVSLPAIERRSKEGRVIVRLPL